MPRALTTSDRCATGPELDVTCVGLRPPPHARRLVLHHTAPDACTPNTSLSTPQDLERNVAEPCGWVEDALGPVTALALDGYGGTLFVGTLTGQVAMVSTETRRVLSSSSPFPGGWDFCQRPHLELRAIRTY